MRTFSGRLWLVKDRYSDVDVEVEIDLDEERLKISSDGSQIGDWHFDDIDVSRDEHEVHLLVEGEELVIVSNDVWFAPAMARTFARSSPTEGEPGYDPDRRLVDEEPAEDASEGRRRRGAHRKRGSFKLRW